MSKARQLVEQLLENEPAQAFGPTAQKILNVIHHGPIRAIGGIVYDSDMRPLMNTTELYHAIRELGQRGIVINRTDSGGSPTWDVEPSVAHMNAMPPSPPPASRLAKLRARRGELPDGSRDPNAY